MMQTQAGPRRRLARSLGHPAGRRAVAALLVVAAGALSSVTNLSEAAALGRTEANPCPVAPRGWVAAASNPTLFGPAQQPGQKHTMVSCDYTQAPQHFVSVVAEYALPSDPNPLSDFYYGCNAHRKQAWTRGGRTYFVASSDRWSYVEFTDPGRQLPDAAAGTFEKTAQTLLKNVSGDARLCAINTATPTVVQHLYLFGFEFLHSAHGLKAFGGIETQSKSNPLIPAGSFEAISEPDATVLTKITSVTAPVFTVHIVENGKQHSLRLRIDHGLDFLQRPPTQRLRLGLDVVGSDYPSCPKGTSGKLTITRNVMLNTPDAPASVRVQLCGALFARGTYRGTALIIGG